MYNMGKTNIGLLLFIAFSLFTWWYMVKDVDGLCTITKDASTLNLNPLIINAMSTSCENMSEVDPCNRSPLTSYLDDDGVAINMCVYNSDDISDNTDNTGSADRLFNPQCSDALTEVGCLGNDNNWPGDPDRSCLNCASDYFVELGDVCGPDDWTGVNDRRRPRDWTDTRTACRGE